MRATPSHTAGTPTEALIERDAELRTLQAALTGAWHGSGRVICILGAAGIGKSQLLAAACEQARALDMCVLSARGHAQEAQFTFGVTRQLFEATLARAAAPERRRLLAGPAAASAVLFGGGTGGSKPGVDPHGFAVAHGLYWLAVSLADRTPLLLTVDDAHLADELSLRSLSYLSRRLAGLAVTIVLTARVRQPPAALEDILSEPSAETLHPASLSASGSSALISSSLPGVAPELADACARISGGNPFLLTELTRTMRTEAWTLGPDDVSRLEDVAPETVTRSVLGRLRGLSGEAVALARAAAVIGDEAPLRHAASVAGVEATAAVPAADALARAEVLTAGDPLVFVHPMAQRAIYRDLAAGERAEMHLYTARLLFDEGADPESVAEHLLRARRDGTHWVVEALLAAAAAASAHGGQAAARTYLLRALEEPPTPATHGDVLCALASAEAALGDPSALDHLAEALRHTDEARQRAEILSSSGRWLVLNGRLDDAALAFAQGLDELGEPSAASDDLALDLRARLVLTSLYGIGPAADAGARLDEIVTDTEAPRTAGERTLLVTLAAAKMSACEDRAGVISLARRAWDGGRLLADETADSLSAHAPAALLALAGELEQAELMCDAAAQEARDRGSPIGYATACYYRLHTRYRRGRLVEAVADAETVAAATAEGWGFAGPAAAGVLAMSLIACGKPQAAASALARTEPPTGASDANTAFWHEGRAHVALAQTDPGRALQALDECARLTEAAGWINPADLDWRSPAALAHAALGDPERGRELADENVALTQAFGEARALGVALRARALVAEEPQRGVLLEQAVATLRESEAMLELARALLELGAHIRRSGARRAALPPLREALDLATRCHAEAPVRRARAELAVCGARPRRAALSGPDALTPSERRVAEMAATGMRTREIAQALFVTPKTVEKHIAGAYDKLGVRSRQALAGALDSGASLGPQR